VNQETITKLGDLLEGHKGSVPVRLHIVDVERNWSIPFTSKAKVKIASQLLDDIKEVTNGEVSLS
jgi:hypothetical protein